LWRAASISTSAIALGAHSGFSRGSGPAARKQAISDIGELIEEARMPFCGRIPAARPVLPDSGAAYTDFPAGTRLGGKLDKNAAMALAYLCGAALSALAEKSDPGRRPRQVKTAEAARKGIRRAFMSGFRGGAVMGMAVVGCACSA
jgi:hypothetical protein